MVLLSVTASEDDVHVYVACMQEVRGITNKGELSTYAFPDVKVNREATTEQGNAQSERADEQTSGRVLGLCVSRSGRLVAALNDRKVICVWHTVDGVMLGSWSTSRKGSVLTFTQDEQTLLVADKSGDVYRCSLSTTDEKPCLIFGHISMILDMLVTSDGRHVVTSDRDEKIRVTRYPATHCIDAYCLGHGEFVSSLCELPRRRLVSGGGDMTVRLWDTRSGRQLDSAPVVDDGAASSDNAHKVAVIGLAAVEAGDTCLLVVHVNSWSRLPVFSVSSSDQLTPVASLLLDGAPVAVAGAGGRLYVLHDTQTPLEVYTPTPPAEPGSTRLQRHQSPLSETAAHSLGPLLQGSLPPVELDWLFKQWFDNVTDYLSRKEARIKAEKKPPPNSVSLGGDKRTLAEGKSAKRLKASE